MTLFLGPAGVLDESEASEFPVILYGNRLPLHDDMALCFEDDEHFRRAAQQLREWPRIEEVLGTLERMEEIQQQADQAAIEMLQRHLVEQLDDKLRRFVEVLGESELTDELQVRAMQGQPPLEPAVFDPVLLYDRPFATSPPTGAPENSSTLPLPGGWWPDLGWFGWGDRARGSRIFGLTVLCDLSWFRGAKRWLVGFNGLVPLAPIGFDRRASSAIVF